MPSESKKNKVKPKSSKRKKDKSVGELVGNLTSENIKDLSEKVEDLENETLQNVNEDRYSKAIELLKTEEGLEMVKKAIAHNICREYNNSLILFFLVLTTFSKKPAAVIVSGESSSGKNTLVKAVLPLFPKSMKLEYSRITGKSLDRMEESLDSKILYVYEFDGIKDEDAQEQLRVLMSEGSLRLLTTVRGEDGNFVTREVVKEGSPFIVTTTIKGSMEEQFATRAWFLSPEENRKHWNEILRYKKDRVYLSKWEQLIVDSDIAKVQDMIRALHKKIDVIIPYADSITLPLEHPKVLRDFDKLIELVKAITFFNQYRRLRATYRGRITVISEVDDLKVALELLEDDFNALMAGTSKAFYKIYQKLRDGRGESEFTKREAATIINKGEARTYKILRSLYDVGLLGKEKRKNKNYYYCIPNSGQSTISKILEELTHFNEEKLKAYLFHKNLQYENFSKNIEKEDTDNGQ